MGNPYIGEIRMFGGNFAPAGWAKCDGQLMPISENTALFALIGTTYGGDGQTTFNLPDLRGRSPIHQGTGSGLSTQIIGEVAGTESVTLTTNTLPQHTHAISGTTAVANLTVPTGAVFAYDGSGITAGYSPAAPNAAMSGNAIAPSGGSQAHNNIQPSLVVTFIISLFGVFPSQN